MGEKEIPEIKSAELSAGGLKIDSIIVLCKLSDGTVRSVNTGRKSESDILNLINNEYGQIPLSSEVINGVDIISPG